MVNSFNRMPLLSGDRQMHTQLLAEARKTGARQVTFTDLMNSLEALKHGGWLAKMRIRDELRAQGKTTCEYCLIKEAKAEFSPSPDFYCSEECLTSYEAGECRREERKRHP